MPTFKHPCPHCGTFIDRDVVACPACGRRDPFTPGRCANCRAPLEDASWVACPKCGQPVGAAAVAATQAKAAGTGQGATPAPAQPVPPASSSGTCSACGSPLAPGARFCRDCGTPVA